MDLYPGEYIIQISKNIIKNNPKIKFENFDSIAKQLTLLSVSESLLLIKDNLKSLGIEHDNFQSETKIVENNEVQKVVNKLKEKKYIFTGKIKAPMNEKKRIGLKESSYFLSQVILAMIKIEHFKSQMVAGHILQVMLPIIIINLRENSMFL